MAALAAAAAGPLLAQDSRPVYLIASLDISDLAAYMDRYGGPVFPLLTAAGAEVVVGTAEAAALEGTYDATWTAVVRFPSQEALEAWYASVEYQALAPERRHLTGSEGSFLIVAPEFQMSPPPE